MKRLFGLFSLALINSSVLYLIYWYIYIASSIKPGNILHIPYEPSGMQLFFYIVSLPLFLIVAVLSLLHSYYFELRKSLLAGIFLTWLSYFILIQFVDMVIHFSRAGNNIVYYGSLLISLVAIFYIIYCSYYQFLELTKTHINN